jgi:hypothetical protein
MTTLETIEETIVKWHPNRGIDRGTGTCPLCKKFQKNDTCGECPLKRLWNMACNAGNTPYVKWVISYRESAYADQIYKDLLFLKEEEIRRISNYS